MVKYQRRFPLFLLFISMVCFLSACKKNMGETTIIGNTEDNGRAVYGATQFAGIADDYQVCESGVVYLSMNQAQYYDFVAKQKYILCNRPNCSHITSSCPAYAKDDNALTGVAYFQNKIYMVRRNDEIMQYELLQLDLTSDEQKVIAVLEIGSYEEDEWVIQHIDNVMYAGTYAWMEVTFGYVSVSETGYGKVDTQKVVLTGIDLTTGNIIELNKVTDNIEDMELEIISADYVVFTKR